MLRLRRRGAPLGIERHRQPDALARLVAGHWDCRPAGSSRLLVARISLPLLLVQACSSAGLAVTALIEHLRRVHRLRRSDLAAVLTVVAGLGLIAATVESSAAAGITTTLIGLIAGGLVASATGLLVRLPGVASGALSGLGFGMAAVAARLVVGDHEHPVWLLWRLPAANWMTGVLAAAGVVCGQLHLSRGLRDRAAAPVLGTNVPGRHGAAGGHRICGDGRDAAAGDVCRHRLRTGRRDAGDRLAAAAGRLG